MCPDVGTSEICLIEFPELCDGAERSKSGSKTADPNEMHTAGCPLGDLAHSSTSF
jgi:hypothetical protein